MTKHLENTLRVANSANVKRRPKGWSPERRARQATLIRGWQPWRRATGPRTHMGRSRSAQNALKHGQRSRARILELQRIRHAIRLCAYTVAAFRAHMAGLPLPPKPIRPEDRRLRDTRRAIMRPAKGLWYCPPPQKAARIVGFTGTGREPWQSL